MLSLSIVIPTYNRLDRLKRVLNALELQANPMPFEVVVVSDGSTDGTNEYLCHATYSFMLVPVLQENRGVAAARNHGVQRASGQVILFLDDDVVPAPQLLGRHMRLHAEHDSVVVLGPMLTPSDFTMLPWVRWEQAMLLKQYHAMIEGLWEPTARQFYTGNTSLLREHIIAVGGFDERFRRAEDVELAYRLADRGLRFIFDPEAIGWHYAERSLASWLAISYAYGRNDVIFSRDKGQSWLLDKVFAEFRERHTFVRAIVWLCLGRKPLEQRVIQALCRLALASERVGTERAVQAVYSGIFNLRYYQGAADELGGRSQFFGRLGNV